MKNVVVLRIKKMGQLAMEVLSTIFQNLKKIDLIEVSAVCKKWYNVVRTTAFCSKIKETNQIFTTEIGS